MMKLMIVFQFSFFIFIFLFNVQRYNDSLEKGQDEQVPVHDGVSLSFAAVSLGCHRNTPDCTLHFLQKLLQAYFTIFASLNICSSITTGWSVFSCHTVIGWVLGATALYDIHTLDGSVKVGG